MLYFRASTSTFCPELPNDLQIQPVFNRSLPPLIATSHRSSCTFCKTFKFTDSTPSLSSSKIIMMNPNPFMINSSDDQFDELYRDCNFFRSYYLIKQAEFKFSSYERLGIEFGR